MSEEQQIEVRCPGCRACYWVEADQLGMEAECGECGRDFTVAEEQQKGVSAVDVTLVGAEDIDQSARTISQYMREHGVSGGVSLEESGSAKDVLETDSGKKYAVGGLLAKGGTREQIEQQRLEDYRKWVAETTEQHQ